jgi:hypothetical protein
MNESYSNYYDLYLKYKTKYVNLKNGNNNNNINQVGGNNTIKFKLDDDKSNEISLLNEFFMLYYKDDDTLLGKKDGHTQTTNIIKNVPVTLDTISYEWADHKYKILFNDFEIPSFNPKYIIKVSNSDINTSVLLTDIYKLHIINYNNLEIKILFKLVDLSPTNYLDTLPISTAIGHIIVKNLSCEFHGTITIQAPIIKGGSRQFNINITRIKIGQDILDILDILPSPINITNSLKIFNREPFNFQESYDRIKKNKKYCEKSTILNKQIYNSLFTTNFIKYLPIYTFLNNNNGNILEKLLENEIDKYSPNIKTTCTSKDLRHMLLNNTMKRINTTFTKGILIDTNNGFEDISHITANLLQSHKISSNRKLNVIFDTGNSSISIIGSIFADALKLPKKKTFNIECSGVVEKVYDKYSEYIDIKIKFDPLQTNIDIGKTFIFRAYIGSTPTTLLLGQSNNVLKDLFDKQYCIGYNEDKHEYNKMKKDAISHLDIYLLNIEKMLIELKKSNYDNIKKIILYMETQYKINSQNKFIDLIDLSSIGSYLTDRPSYDKYDYLYNMCIELKSLISNLKKTNPAISSDKTFEQVFDILDANFIGDNFIS